MTDPLSEMLEANRRSAEAFTGGELPRPPSRAVAVLTCLDGRVVPERFLQLELGAANVLRNAGGRVTEDVIRSLTVAAWLLDARTFLVIHHTDCGLLAESDEVLRGSIADKGGNAGDLPLLSFPDLEEGVRADVAALRSCAALPEGVRVAGLVYDVRTGALEIVEPLASR